MEACVHRMLYCSAANLVWTSFASGLWPAGTEAPMGSDLVYSILSPEWNDKTRVKVRY
jgi:hypothetical protein